MPAWFAQHSLAAQTLTCSLKSFPLSPQHGNSKCFLTPLILGLLRYPKYAGVFLSQSLCTYWPGMLHLQMFEWQHLHCR